ncbi:MAG: tetratricopeptide repeat protein, partial [Elusimicrobia bacterium]|nr:tetratricopeptide repeat protein [Elusimicrobiota bacterium]
MAVIMLAGATPAAGQPATDEEEPTAEELAQFELLRQRSLEEKGISLSAAGIVPAPVAGSPVVPSRPQPSWEESERERAIPFDAQFGDGAYAGIAGFSKRCKFADGCNRFAAVDVLEGAYQFVDLQKDVEENNLAPDSSAYRDRQQEIKGGIRSAMEDFRPRPGANPAYEAEFIKVSDPIVKKIFSKEELLQYAERNAASSDSAAFYTYLGQALNGAGPPGRAREAFDEALRRNPASDDALSGRAVARLNMGDYPGAIRDAVAALKLNPRNARAYAALRFSEGRAAGAGSAGVFAASGAGSPPSPGGGAGAAGSFSGGADSSLHGGAGNPVSFDSLRRSDALVADARRRLSLGDPGAAVELLGKAVELNPRNAEALALTAMARIRTKDYAGALAAAEAGLKLAPNSVPLLDAKANALNYLKEYRGALAAADLALLANPDDAMAHYNRAWALGGLDDREGALASLRSAARLNPQFAPALASALDLPPEEDILYLFPGEVRGVRPEAAAPAPGSGRPSWLLLGAGAAGILAALLLVARRKRPAAPPPLSSFRKVPELLDGKFEVGREIGSGGMGVVYEGRDRSLDRAVAVKRMREEIRWDPRERARFVAEAKLVAKLHHPHIVEIHTIV